MQTNAEMQFNIVLQNRALAAKEYCDYNEPRVPKDIKSVEHALFILRFSALNLLTAMEDKNDLMVSKNRALVSLCISYLGKDKLEELGFSCYTDNDSILGSAVKFCNYNLSVINRLKVTYDGPILPDIGETLETIRDIFNISSQVDDDYLLYSLEKVLNNFNGKKLTYKKMKFYMYCLLCRYIDNSFPHSLKDKRPLGINNHWPYTYSPKDLFIKSLGKKVRPRIFKGSPVENALVSDRIAQLKQAFREDFSIEYLDPDDCMFGMVGNITHHGVPILPLCYSGKEDLRYFKLFGSMIYGDLNVTLSSFKIDN